MTDDDMPEPITITTPDGEDFLALQVYQQVAPPAPLNTTLPSGTWPGSGTRRRFDACQTDCTPDCGHCKGDPVGALRTQLRKVEAAQADLARDLRDGMDILRDTVAGDMSTATLVEIALRLADELGRRRDETPHVTWGGVGRGFCIEVKPGRELMKALAVEMMDVLEAEAGPNYVQWDVKPAGQVLPYRLILVRPGGKSPHELRRDAEAERDTARRLLAEHADCDDDQCRREIDAALGREGTPA